MENKEDKQRTNEIMKIVGVIIAVLLLIILFSFLVFKGLEIGLEKADNVVKNIANEINYGEHLGTIVNKFETYKRVFPYAGVKKCYCFVIQKEVDGKVKEEEILVTEEIYDRYTVGDYFEEKNNLGNEITNEI